MRTKKPPHLFYISEKLCVAKVKCSIPGTMGNKEHSSSHKFLLSANDLPIKVVTELVPNLKS